MNTCPSCGVPFDAAVTGEWCSSCVQLEEDYQEYIGEGDRGERPRPEEKDDGSQYSDDNQNSVGE